MRSQKTSTPSQPNSPSDTTSPIDLAKSESPTDSLPAIPSVHRSRPPLYSPIQPTISPFPARTPRTPEQSTSKVIATSCTADEPLFTLVKVHTAKCTECDKRNRDMMRRCPGCTFQVCKPCFERRKEDGRGLMHGNSMSNATPQTTAQRMVRRKLFSTVDATKIEERDNDEEEEVQVQYKTRKQKQKSFPTLKFTGRKRVSRGMLDIKDLTAEESSSVPSDDDFHPPSASLTPRKRRHSAITSLGSSQTPKTPMRLATSSSGSRITKRPKVSTGVGLEGLDINGLLQVFGVNTPENPYQEHLLGRREPVLSNPVIVIPDIVKRGFKPRATATEIRKEKQRNTLKKIQEGALQNIAARQEIAAENAHSLTVRFFVKSEAAKYQDDVMFDRDENEALLNAIKEEARQWCNKIYSNLEPDMQSMVQRGLDMRLDLIESHYGAELARLVEACASHKVKELIDNNG